MLSFRYLQTASSELHSKGQSYHIYKESTAPGIRLLTGNGIFLIFEMMKGRFEPGKYAKSMFQKKDETSDRDVLVLWIYEGFFDRAASAT